MPLPASNLNPAFDTTRFSHVRLNVADLDASRDFYENFIGLFVTEADSDRVYLRGVEEIAHHSLVLQKGDKPDGPPIAESIGFRVQTDEQLDVAKSLFDERGLPSEYIEQPFQGRTLRYSDAGGVVVELTARMDTLPRYSVTTNLHKGAAPANIDHCQVHAVDVDKAAAFYTEDLGFRISEYITMNGDIDNEPLLASFLARKGNANDVVIVKKPGPRLHHFSYVIHDAPAKLLHLCDLADSLGIASQIEWGPSRHGLGGEIFMYMRDPDGHRVELLSHPYRFTDLEEEPFGWARVDPRLSMLYGPKPPDSWQLEASPFAGVPVQEPADQTTAAIAR